MDSAMLARSHDFDSLYQDVRKILSSFSIHRLGRIKTLYNDKEQADEGDILHTTRATIEFLDFDEFGTSHTAAGVELLYPGSKKDGVRYNVEIGDYVLVLGFANALVNITDQTVPSRPEKAFPFSGATMKALPIQPSVISQDHVVTEMTEDGRLVHVKTNLSIDLPEEHTLDLAVGTTTIGIADDGALNLSVAEGKCTLSITADGDVNLSAGDGNCTVDITADGAVTLDCADALTVTAGGDVKVSADGDMKVTANSVDFNSGALKVAS